MSAIPSHTAQTPNSPDSKNKPIPLTEIEAAIRSIRHGTVQIVVQDGVVVQIDKTEKMRLR